MLAELGSGAALALNLYIAMRFHTETYLSIITRIKTILRRNRSSALLLFYVVVVP